MAARAPKPPFRPAPIVGSNDCLMPVSVSTSADAHRRQSLHCRHTQHRYERQHRIVCQLAMTFKVGHLRAHMTVRFGRPNLQLVITTRHPGERSLTPRGGRQQGRLTLEAYRDGLSSHPGHRGLPHPQPAVLPLPPMRRPQRLDELHIVRHDDERPCESLQCILHQGCVHIEVIGRSCSTLC